MLTFTLEGLDELEREWESAINSTLARGAVFAVNKAIDDGVSAAKTEHRYKDQTGKLTKSIQKEPAALSIGNSFDSEGSIFTDSPYANIVENGSKPHEIRPKNARALAWQSNGEWRHAAVVHHPGTQPHPFMGIAYTKAERSLEAQLEAACARFAEVMNRG